MGQLNLSSENRLLIYCSRLNLDEDIKLRTKEILNEALNWNYILDCSTKQGISPLLYWNLSKISNGKDVPCEIQKNLKKMYYNNLARNMLLYDELKKILKAFKRANIDTVVMKGAFLAEGIYKNISLRSMSDIDLLIKKEDLQKVKKELNKLIYFVTIKFPTKLHEQFQTVVSEELSFVNENKKVIIDIHWNIQPPQSCHKIEIDEFWNNVKSVMIKGIETLTFGPENTLQHLCLHLDKHINLDTTPTANPLRDYCDIAEVTRYYKNTINWDYLLESSKNFGIEEPVFEKLYISNRYFGAFVPEGVLDKFEPLKSNVYAQEIFIELIEGNPRKAKAERKDNYITNLKLINGLCNKVYVIFGDIFPSKEYMTYRYSIKDEKQVYRYYLTRIGAAFIWGLTNLWRISLSLFRDFFR